MNPLLAQLQHAAFPDLADALRAEAAPIVLEWDSTVREALPQMDRLTLDELKDNVPLILLAISDALASPDPDQIATLVDRAPKQGLARFHQQAGLAEVMQEDRLLRAIVVLHIEDRLRRQLRPDEAASLHATIDVMFQGAVIAMVDEQKAHLRDVTERELKFVSFLSHDLNNNLNAVTLTLQLLRQQLGDAPQFADALDAVTSAEQTIHNTVAGMRRLLEHERLRRGDPHATTRRRHTDLYALLTSLVRPFARDALAKRLDLSVDVPPDAAARTDPDLVSLVLQNLLGNAVKYTSHGGIRLHADPLPPDASHPHAPPRWSLSVSDQGPGIPPEHLDHIFQAFRRGDPHHQKGVGLGLAIAAQAARLLDADLTVRSHPGQGSTFSLLLP